MASRAFARLPPGFMRVSGRWVVVGHCMDGATEGRATKENGLQAVPELMAGDAARRLHWRRQLAFRRCGHHFFGG